MNYGTWGKGKPTVGETNVLSVKKKVCGDHHSIHIHTLKDGKTQNVGDVIGEERNRKIKSSQPASSSNNSG
jgi:hypothetical protein